MGSIFRSRTRAQEFRHQESMKPAEAKQVMESTSLGPMKGPDTDRARHTSRPGTGMPLLFWWDRMVGRSLPRDILMSMVAEAIKKPFQVVKRPATAPMVMAQ